MTQKQSTDIERLQFQGLKCVYGLQFSYAKLLEKAGLERLDDRRVVACDNFAKKCLEGRFAHWFPTRDRREGLRKGKKYIESYARCERLKNTPIYYMRRRLNEIDGQ